MLYVSKYDNAGFLMWNKQISGSTQNCISTIACDRTGNPFVSGYFATTLGFSQVAGIGDLESQGSDDIFVFKLGEFVSI